MIPKIIHQIWVGDKKIPKHIKEWMNEVRDKHPDFKYYLWTDENLPNMPDKLFNIYKDIPDPTKTSAKSDFLRMYVVYKFGGMYLDADFKHINGFHNSIIDFDNIDGMITVSDAYGMSALGCNFFGFSKGNVLLKMLIDNIQSSNEWLGPNYWANTFAKYFDYKELVTFDQFQKDLNPYKIDIINTSIIESEYFQHIALASWVPNSEWNNKLINNTYE